MAQNIYDDETFFEGYSRLGALGRGAGRRRGVAGAAGHAAGARRSQGRRSRLRLRLVLPLGARAGCGAGARHRRLRADAGARPGQHQRRRDHLPEGRHGAAGSARGVVRSRLQLARAALRRGSRQAPRRRCTAPSSPGGTLVFSVEHPIFTAPRNPGWSVDAAGRKIWPVDGYLLEGTRSTDWLAKGVIKQHRTIATYVGLLLRLGLRDRAPRGMGSDRRADRRAAEPGGRAAAAAVPAGGGATHVIGRRHGIRSRHAVAASPTPPRGRHE